MKRILLAVAVSITTAAFAVGAVAEDQHPNRGAAKGTKARSTGVTTARASNGAGVQRSHQFSGQQSVSRRSFTQPATVSGQTNVNGRVMRSNVNANRISTRERGYRRAQVTTANTATTDTSTSGRFARQQNIRTQRALAGGTNRDITVNRVRNVNRNVTLVNNWRGDRFTGRSYTAFRNYRRTWHDRSWWRGHYDRLIFVSGGWYFWNLGYWYPAWGYDPGYYYPYDGPIYGYGALTPDQVVMNVQLQLRDDGYYTGPIDGVLGSQTRYALAAFQADHGLAVTSAVDQPTLATLGLV